MGKVTAETEKKLDKYINEQCGGWKSKKTGYSKTRRDIINGKIILDPAAKESFKAGERFGKKYKL